VAAGSSGKSGRKRVSWVDTERTRPLEDVRHFYLDEEEREIKKCAFKGGEYKDGDMKKIEMLSEKGLRFQMTSSYGFNNNYELSEERASPSGASAWTLVTIDLPADLVIYEVRSLEKEIQAKRELNVLQCFLTKEYLPDTPGEPATTDVDEQVKTRLIPLEDVTGGGVDTKSGESAEIEEKPHSPVVGSFGSFGPAESTSSSYSNGGHNYQHREQFYNPAKSLTPAAVELTATTTSAGASSSTGGGLSIASLDNDYLKQILQTVRKTSETTAAATPPAHSYHEPPPSYSLSGDRRSSSSSSSSNNKKTLLNLDADTIRAAEASATHAATSPTGDLPPAKHEYKRSRWSDEPAVPITTATVAETNSGWSSTNNKYGGSGSSTTTANTNGYSKSYYNSDNSSSGGSTGRNVFTNNFKRGIGNRGGGGYSSTSGSTNNTYRAGYSNGSSSTNNSYNGNSRFDSSRGYQNNSHSNSGRGGYNNNSYNANKYSSDRKPSSSGYSSRRDEDSRETTTERRSSPTRVEAAPVVVAAATAVPVVTASVSGTNLSSGKWL
jgi:hypothetical protein